MKFIIYSLKYTCALSCPVNHS